MAAVRLAAWLLRRLARRGTSPAEAAPDPIGQKVHAAIAADTAARADNSRCYQARVHAMAEELFLRMDRDAPHSHL